MKYGEHAMKSLSRQLITAFFILLGSATAAFADTIWIDVRSVEEYSQDHIAGDINIPHTAIGTEIGKHVTDKDSDIILYCRSGKRAGMAMKMLKEMGYTNVTNAGGIEDARALRKTDTQQNPVTQ